MNRNSIKSMLHGIRVTLIKHSPEILIGIGITGMVTSTVFAVRATPKAIQMLDERKKELDVEKLDTKETVKTAWSCYIPAAVTGVLSAACIVGASSVHIRRNAALATAYTLSESALQEYQNKVIEVIGETKEQSIKDSIAKDQVERNPVKNNELIITGNGTSLCYDAHAGRYFESDINSIKSAINNLNRLLLNEMYVSLNDFYYELGLDPTKGGDDLGWNLSKGLIDINFSSQISTDGRPCIVLNYSLAPVYDYNKF